MRSKSNFTLNWAEILAFVRLTMNVDRIVNCCALCNRNKMWFDSQTSMQKKDHSNLQNLSQKILCLTNLTVFVLSFSNQTRTTKGHDDFRMAS